MKQGKILRKNFEIAVPEANREILKKIINAEILPPKAYLAGGTAVAMYYGHRLSEDFDFFTWEPFNAELITAALKKEFFKVEFTFILPHTIVCYLFLEKTLFTKFSIFRLPYKLIDDPVSPGMDENLGNFPINIASLKDLLCMKAVVIAQRGSAKDFVDLFYLLKDNPINFSELCKYIGQKYGLKESFYYQLKTGMRYFEDAEQKEMMEKVLMFRKERNKYNQITKNEWGGIKKFFVNLSR